MGMGWSEERALNLTWAVAPEEQSVTAQASGQSSPLRGLCPLISFVVTVGGGMCCTVQATDWLCPKAFPALPP